MEIVSPRDALVQTESVCRLSPEKPFDIFLARVADLASLEALNPEEATHNAMTAEQLERWRLKCQKTLLSLMV